MLKCLAGKRLIWAKYIRIFTDNGFPIIRYIPRIHRSYYSPYWNMFGFKIYFLGREFNFSFGEDINGLYGRHK